jgi:hypothetical protein
LVREAVPAQEHEELHHHHLVDVWPSSPGSVVPVEAGDDGSEGLSVYEGLHLCEAVAELLNLLVGLAEQVGFERVHGFLWGGAAL